MNQIANTNGVSQIEEKNVTFVTIPVSPSLEHSLRVAAAHIGVSRAELCRRILADGLKRLREGRGGTNN